MSLPRELSQGELRNDSGEVMRALEQGESFIVTRNGMPIGSLTPLKESYFTKTTTAIGLMRRAPKIDYKSLRADLDAVADQDPTPRV
jgi:prevent-host-death family protein